MSCLNYGVNLGKSKLQDGKKIITYIFNFFNMNMCLFKIKWNVLMEHKTSNPHKKRKKNQQKK